MPEILVRPYQPGDREAVRTLACDTADRGEPVERFFSDRALFADLVTIYYTDYEPQSLWVAQQEGRTIGYLTGCLDTCRYRRILLCRVAPKTLVRALARGSFWSAQTWRLAAAGARTFAQGGFLQPRSLDGYPAHLHLNIRHGFRGQGVGRQLLERFLAHAQAAGIPGVHASVRSDNLPSCGFFERLGFTTLSRHPRIFAYGALSVTYDTVVYGKRL